MTLSALIAKLEAATEGSRELDSEIALFLGWKYEKRGNSTKAWWYRPGIENDYARSSDSYRHQWPNMSWSTSIDAALTLVPKGWTRDVEATVPELGVDVMLGDSRQVPQMTFVTGDHKVEAIATCIAALKARNV